MEEQEKRDLPPIVTEKVSLRRQAWSFIWETFKVVIVSLAIVLPVRYYLVQPFFVKGASMEPTFHDANYILIDEISYRFHEPERGDIVVFKYPLDQSQFFIKRVIGMPGETIDIRNNKVIIKNKQHPDGFALDESSYLSPSLITDAGNNTPLTLRSNQYFVMGDNRTRSSDSRFWGPVNRELITGRVFFRAFPLNQIGKFKEVNYQ